MWYRIRVALSNFFGTIAWIAWGVLIFCIWLGQYIGVYILYVCIPTGIAATFLWWLFCPKD